MFVGCLGTGKSLYQYKMAQQHRRRSVLSGLWLNGLRMGPHIAKRERIQVLNPSDPRVPIFAQERIQLYQSILTTFLGS